MVRLKRPESRPPEEQLKEFARSLPKRLSGPIAIRQAGGSIEQTSLVFRDSQPFAVGGTSVLFRVHNPSLNEDRILKVRTVPLEDSTEWQHEWSTLVKLSRRGSICIPRIYSVGTIEELPVLVMSVVEGQTLADVIQSWQRNPSKLPASPDVFLRFVRRVMADTFATMQRISVASKGQLVHGDLKPGNLMIQCQEEQGDYWADPFSVWILDFGEASIWARDRRGLTPRYASPEQMLTTIGKASQPLTHASDQYQLGVLLDDLLDFFDRRYAKKLWNPVNFVTARRARALRRLAVQMTARQPARRCRDFHKAQSSLGFRWRQPYLSMAGSILLLSALGTTGWVFQTNGNQKLQIAHLQTTADEHIQWRRENGFDEATPPPLDETIEQFWARAINEFSRVRDDVKGGVDSLSIILTGRYGRLFAEKFRSRIYERLVELEAASGWSIPVFGVRDIDGENLFLTLTVDGRDVANRLPIKPAAEASGGWRGVQGGFRRFDCGPDSVIEMKLERGIGRALGLGTSYTLLGSAEVRGRMGLASIGELRGFGWADQVYRGPFAPEIPKLGDAVVKVVFERTEWKSGEALADASSRRSWLDYFMGSSLSLAVMEPIMGDAAAGLEIEKPWWQIIDPLPLPE